MKTRIENDSLGNMPFPKPLGMASKRPGPGITFRFRAAGRTAISLSPTPASKRRPRLSTPEPAGSRKTSALRSCAPPPPSPTDSTTNSLWSTGFRLGPERAIT